MPPNSGELPTVAINSGAVPSVQITVAAVPSASTCGSPSDRSHFVQRVAHSRSPMTQAYDSWKPSDCHEPGHTHTNTTADTSNR